MIKVLIVAAVIYVVWVVTSMLKTKNEQIKGLQKSLDAYIEEADKEVTRLTDENRDLNIKAVMFDNLKKTYGEAVEKIEKLTAENKELKNADARNVGLYYKIADLTREVEELRKK